MSPDRIKQLLSRRPFEPFSVVTGDGADVPVLSPEFAYLKPGDRTLEVFRPKTRNPKDESDFEGHTIDVFLITKAVSPVKSNGSRRPKK